MKIYKVEFFEGIIYNRTMKDLIEERDKKEKMNHSIVKWWNVHYMTSEELEEMDESLPGSMQGSGHSAHTQGPEEHVSSSPQMNEQPQMEQADMAQEIIDRLNREAAEDEARKQQEIEQARMTAEANFNEATGAYSGAYGANGVKDKHREQIDAILAEKDEALRDLIQRTGEE